MTRLSGREPLPERAEPTHTLHIKVPIRIQEGTTYYIDPMKDAVQLVLALSRISTLGVLCGSPVVSVEEHER
jgi:hypothetical protein